jgi:D-amino-acid dehydrogenase
VLGAGIVGTSVALHLVRRGLGVALIDRQGAGEGTSYGNAGIIESNTLLPPAFPSDWKELARIALKRSPIANYHLSHLPRIAPWLMAFRAVSRPGRLVETAQVMRPLLGSALTEHAILASEAGAQALFNRGGWLKLYRSARAYAALAPEFALAAHYGITNVALDRDAVRALEPALGGPFRHAVHWTGAVNITDPLALTRAYAAQFAARGGLLLKGDARSLHRAHPHWRVDTASGPVDGTDVVVALGPWAGDLLALLDLKLPLAVKRGYHLTFRGRNGAMLGRPVLDAERGYVLAPMASGIRVTTGAEFAPRDARPTPVQLNRLLPSAREIFPLGEAVERQAWLGARPCLPDSRPVISPAPRRGGTRPGGLWLAVGHAHWGLTLGPATGRLIGEMITGATPYCDPAPFSADRFFS